MKNENHTRLIDLTVVELKSIIKETINNRPTSIIPIDDKPLNTKQAADFLGNMPLPTFRYKLKKFKIPSILQSGRRYFFKNELIDWLKSYRDNNDNENEIFENISLKITKNHGRK